jgi:hypothetical protein
MFILCCVRPAYSSRNTAVYVHTVLLYQLCKYFTSFLNAAPDYKTAVYNMVSTCSMLYIFFSRHPSLLNPVSVFLRYQMFKLLYMNIVFKGQASWNRVVLLILCDMMFYSLPSFAYLRYLSILSSSPRLWLPITVFLRVLQSNLYF